MIFYIIPTILIIISLGYIIYIFIKKLPDMATLNIESMSQEKESKVRKRIMTERINRSFTGLKKSLKPVSKKITDSAGKIYQKTVEMEKTNLKNKPLKNIDISQNIKEKISKVQEAITKEELDKAEETCIDILEIDSKNLDAYELLCKIYQRKKDYKKARETCRYAIKMLIKNKAQEDSEGQKLRLANCYSDLGFIYQTEGKNEQALANFEKAVDLEPNNPRFLDLLLKISIILENKNLALQVFNNLKKTDPQNKRLKEIKEEIENLPT